MKTKSMLTALLLCVATLATAQPQGFGGFQMPENKATVDPVDLLPR